MQLGLKRIPQVESARCLACGECVSACPHHCLELRGGICHVVRPDACGSEGICTSACSESALRMDWVEMQGRRTMGQWRRQPARTHADSAYAD